MRKVFVFSLIVAGIRAIKSELANMINQNAQFHASIENLKAVANGFVMQLANMVLPAFIAVVNVLAGLLERIAGLIDYIFGTNIVGMIQQARANASSQIQQSNAQQSAEYSSKVAKAQNKQAKSADKLAKAQKKANAQLLAFDELNVMNAEDAEEAADAVDDYADMMEPIEQPELQTDWTQIPLPDMGLLNGFLSWLDELRNRIATDVEGPFARIREGLNLIKQGIAEVIQGVSTGDWALVWQGLGDIVIGTLYVIEGALDAFLDWLDEATGGRFTGIIQGIEQIIHGLVEVIEGLLRGDLPTFVQGLYDIVDGVVNTVNSLVETIINGVLDLISRFFDYSLGLWDELFNKLEERFPGFKDALEGLKLFIMGGLGVIQGAIEGALVFIRDLVTGSMDALGQIVKGAIDFIVGLFTMDGSMIEQGIKGMLNGVISLLETAINSFLDGALWMLNDVISAVNWATGQNYGYASINWITLPRLAQGAVIPPNREFMAVLGDQTSGNNIEAPESLLRQIVSEESGNAQLVTLLTQILQAVQNGHTLQCDGVTLAKVVNDRNAAGYKLYGW